MIKDYKLVEIILSFTCVGQQKVAHFADNWRRKPIASNGLSAEAVPTKIEINHNIYSLILDR